eukprot:7225110-Pyramimonas_sp.AAC.1
MATTRLCKACPRRGAQRPPPGQVALPAVHNAVRPRLNSQSTFHSFDNGLVDALDTALRVLALLFDPASPRLNAACIELPDVPEAAARG